MAPVLELFGHLQEELPSWDVWFVCVTCSISGHIGAKMTKIGKKVI